MYDNHGIVYSMLIGTFRDGDWFLGFLFWIVAGVVSLFLLAGIFAGIDAWQWHQTPHFEHPGVLLSNNFKSSTRRSHAVPVATGNGVGVGMVTTGEDEKYITVWDCGKYGRLVADDETVYRWAKPKSILFLKAKDGKARIVGIMEKK